MKWRNVSGSMSMTDVFNVLGISFNTEKKLEVPNSFPFYKIKSKRNDNNDDGSEQQSILDIRR